LPFDCGAMNFKHFFILSSLLTACTTTYHRSDMWGNGDSEIQTNPDTLDLFRNSGSVEFLDYFGRFSIQAATGNLLRFVRRQGGDHLDFLTNLASYLSRTASKGE